MGVNGSSKGLCAVLSIVFGCASRAGVYYVDVDNGSDSNDGTSQVAAWAHLPGSVGYTGAGWVRIEAGDTVCVKGGTTNFVSVRFSSSYYNGSTNFDSVQVISGHLTTPPWGDGRAVFDEMNTGTFGFWIASGSDCNGLTIDGFEVRNIAAGGVGTGFDPVNGSCCIAVGGNNGARYTEIRRCYLHHASRDDDDRGHGIETDGSGGSTQLIVEYNTIGPNIGTKGVECLALDHGAIRGNYFNNTGDHAIVVSGSHWDVCNNVVRMVPPYAHDPVYAIKLNRNHNDVWNNLLFQQDTPDPTPVDQRASGFGLLPESSFNRFYHNTIYNFANTPNGREYGAGIAIGAENAIVGNNEIQNNIVYNCRNRNGGIQLYLFLYSPNTKIRYNDLFYTNVTDKTVNFGTNLYSAAQFNGAAALDPTWRVGANQQAPPGFVAGRLPDGLDEGFHPNSDYFKLTLNSDRHVRYSLNMLKSTSTNGYSNSEDKFDSDILGNKRVLWSMGAYEFERPLSATTNLRIIQAH
jgi:hypothetical protein